MNINFASNLLSQGSTEQDNLSKNVKKNSFISVLNFNTELAKKRTIYDFLFFIALYSSKNGNKYLKLAPQQSLYYNQSFYWFRTHFDDRP